MRKKAPETIEMCQYFTRGGLEIQTNAKACAECRKRPDVPECSGPVKYVRSEK